MAKKLKIDLYWQSTIKGSSTGVLDKTKAENFRVMLLAHIKELEKEQKNGSSAPSPSK